MNELLGCSRRHASPYSHRRVDIGFFYPSGTMEGLRIELEENPIALYVKPAVGYQVGTLTTSGSGELIRQDRDEFYKTTHLQAIAFDIAHRIVHKLVGDRNTEPDPGKPKLRCISRHRLFPQVFRLVDTYVEKKVDFGRCNPCELGHEKYVMRIVDQCRRLGTPRRR